jgi:hypothetical protein
MVLPPSALIDRTSPAAIRTEWPLELRPAIRESAALAGLHRLAPRNCVLTSMIGMCSRKGASMVSSHRMIFISVSIGASAGSNRMAFLSVSIGAAAGSSAHAGAERAIAATIARKMWPDMASLPLERALCCHNV